MRCNEYRCFDCVCKCQIINVRRNYPIWPSVLKETWFFVYAASSEWCCDPVVYPEDGQPAKFSCLTTVFWAFSCSGSSAVSVVSVVHWGMQNEADAMKEFETVSNNEVTPAGLFIDECGFLGASHGFVGDNGLLELKCTYKARSSYWVPSKIWYNVSAWVTMTTVIWSVNTLIVTKSKYRSIFAKKDVCNLYVWSPSGSIYLLIYRDQECDENLY